MYAPRTLQEVFAHPYGVVNPWRMGVSQSSTVVPNVQLLHFICSYTRTIGSAALAGSGAAVLRLETTLTWVLPTQWLRNSTNEEISEHRNLMFHSVINNISHNAVRITFNSTMAPILGGTAEVKGAVHRIPEAT